MSLSKYVKNGLLFAVFFQCTLLGALSQEVYKITYAGLKEYEGKYEYLGNSTLEIAASPRDLKLYAIIDEARYPLTPAAKDLFLNPGKQEVSFLRNASDAITGYTVKDGQAPRLFKLLSKQVSFPESMWYPRKNATAYKCAKPSDLRDGLPTATLEGTGLDAAALTQMVNKITDESHSNVHSVLIIKNGKLVFEEYFYEYDINTLHQIRSATKSFVSALVGIAIGKGIIKSKHEPIASFFPEYNFSEEKKQITIQHMLNNQSGLDCNDHDGNSPGNEVKMYPAADWVKFILDLPMAGKPGAEARYCSGNVMTLARIIEKASGKSLYAFAKENLFDPIGASGYKWDFKADSSQMNTFGQLYIKPRDMAKFGLLYLNKGRWNNKQVIPEAWVAATLTPQTKIDNTAYGYLWWHPWLNVNGKRNDAITARGNGGQRIYLRPDLDMVVVITAGSYNTESSADKLLAYYILPAYNR
jgi:CubicO group peptidase (beta-lactamase class C family)